MNARNIAIVTVLFCAFLASIGQLLMKLGANASFAGENMISYFLDYYVLGGIACYAVSAVLYLLALKYADLSTLYPFIASSYVWVIFFSAYYLEETITITKGGGIALVLAGLGLLATG